SESSRIANCERIVKPGSPTIRVRCRNGKPPWTRSPGAFRPSRLLSGSQGTCGTCGPSGWTALTWRGTRSTSVRLVLVDQHEPLPRLDNLAYGRHWGIVSDPRASRTRGHGY